MCGFAGIININKLVDKGFLERQLNKAYNFLKVRGPDQKGMWHDNNAYFLHTRLKILDLKETASQPMEYEQFVITYNGEIYNFKNLRNILTKEGYKFRSSGDTEVLVAGWKHWGPGVLDRLDGMFSFSIWDKKKKTLYLARDRFGKKPLVFSIFHDSIAFSSDIRSLSKIAYSGKINKRAIESLFRFRFIHEPLTIYENFQKLPAGSFLKFNAQEVKIKKWFEINKKTSFYSEETMKRKIMDLTVKAVEKRLVSDVPLGVFLSGGIDSGIISSCLAMLNKKVPHFTVGFKNQGGYYDESKYAAKLAGYLGFEHHILSLDDKKIKPLIDDITSTSDEPFADSSAIPMYLIAKETSNYLKVALSGDGGDEVFGGYRKYMAYRWSLFTNLFPNIIRYPIGKALPNSKENKFYELVRKFRRLLINSNLNSNKMQISFLDQLSDQESFQLFGKQSNIETSIFKNVKGYDDKLNLMLARDIEFSLPGDMLVKVDRYSMRHSIEMRSPFLDRDLVEYAFNISGKKKIGFFSGKKVLRKVFLDKFPKGYLNLPKKGFEVPLDKWLKNDLKFLVEDACSNKILDSLEIKNKNIIKSWKSEFFSGKSDNSWKLWTLISYSKWAEFNKNI